MNAPDEVERKKNEQNLLHGAYELRDIAKSSAISLSIAEASALLNNLAQLYGVRTHTYAITFATRYRSKNKLGSADGKAYTRAPKITDEAKAKVHQMWSEGTTAIKIAREMGICTRSVYTILNADDNEVSKDDR